MKRLIWCQEQQRTKEEFKDVIFMDESTVQLEQYSRLCKTTSVKAMSQTSNQNHHLKKIIPKIIEVQENLSGY